VGRKFDRFTIMAVVFLGTDYITGVRVSMSRYDWFKKCQHLQFCKKIKWTDAQTLLKSLRKKYVKETLHEDFWRFYEIAKLQGYFAFINL